MFGAPTAFSAQYKDARVGAIAPEAGEAGEAGETGEADGDSADMPEQHGCSDTGLLDINTRYSTCIYTQ